MQDLITWQEFLLFFGITLIPGYFSTWFMNWIFEKYNLIGKTVFLTAFLVFLMFLTLTGITIYNFINYPI